MPGRQAFLVQMVEDRQDLGNAIAINSSMVNLAGWWARRWQVWSLPASARVIAFSSTA